MKCPLCSNFKNRNFAHWPQFSILQCTCCGFCFVDTTAPDYPQDAQYIHDEPEIGLIQPGLPHIQRRVVDILRFKKPPGQSLDIGCGKGEASLAMQQAGFAAMGIDMKSYLMTHLKKHHPEVDWRTCTAEDLLNLSERFDVLTMYHVLEHVSDPRAVLSTVKKLANPDALIVIEVPNRAGLKARLKGTKWNYYKVDHVNYFRPTDLHRLADELGLTVLATRGYQHFSYPQNVMWKDLIKGVLALIGFRDVVSVFLRA